jgi:hypothetical protein
MDRVMLEQHLAQAERHVIEGESHVKRQRELVAGLKRDGHDASQAIDLLRQFEQLQEMHVADRDRLRKELSNNPRD